MSGYYDEEDRSERFWNRLTALTLVIGWLTLVGCVVIMAGAGR